MAGRLVEMSSARWLGKLRRWCRWAASWSMLRGKRGVCVRRPNPLGRLRAQVVRHAFRARERDAASARVRRLWLERAGVRQGVVAARWRIGRRCAGGHRAFGLPARLCRGNRTARQALGGGAQGQPYGPALGGAELKTRAPRKTRRSQPSSHTLAGASGKGKGEGRNPGRRDAPRHRGTSCAQEPSLGTVLPLDGERVPTMSDTPSPAWTVRQVAEYPSVDERAVCRMVDRGELCGPEVGAMGRCRWDGIDSWIEQQQREAAAASQGRGGQGNDDW